MTESTADRIRSGGAPLAALLLAMAAWAGWFIFRTSFTAGGQRVFCLCEDAMVAMTCARHLAAGHGLAWALGGAPADGFTNPLWLALMVPVNALPGLALRHRSLLVQLLSLGALAANVVLVRRLTLRHFAAGPARHWMPAALLTAFYYPLAYWSLMGLETALQALLITAMVLVALDVADLGADRHLALWLLATAAVLVRLDMFLMVIVVEVFVLWGRPRRLPPSGWWLGLGIFAAANTGYALFCWRLLDDVPPTWYLELHRIPLDGRLMRGAKLLSASWGDHLLLLAVVGAGVGVLARSGADRRLARWLALPTALFVAACAYSVYVGGDVADMDVGMRANRFVAFVMPLVFVLFNALLNQVSARLAMRGAARGAARPPGAAGAPAAEPAAASTVALDAGDLDLARRYLVTFATVLALLIADGLWLAADNAGNWQALIVANRPYMVRANEQVYAKLRRLEAALPPQPGTTVASTAIGIPAYFGPYTLVDLLDREERHITRLAPAVPQSAGDLMAFMPGQESRSTAAVLERYRPAAVLDSWGLDDPAPLLRAAGYRFLKDGGFWLRGGAPAAAGR